VIYGEKTGVFPDATIKQVAFSRDGDDLVTSFQVNGQISETYDYQIAVLLSPNPSDGFTYKIVSCEFCGVNSTSFFFVKSNASTTPIEYTIEGDTWTAWTPLSLMGGRSHFWVWVGILDSFNSWMDMLPSPPQAVNYEIQLPVGVTFFVDPQSIAGNVTLNVDGRGNKFDASGELSILLDPETPHNISIAPIIKTSNDVQYLFESWSDLASGKSSRTTSFDQDKSVTISYVRQFRLTVNSDYADTHGAGWYDEESNVTFSVSPSQLPYGGFLGTLGLQHQFTGWSGSVVAHDASSSTNMDGPKMVQANWKTTTSPIFLVFVGIVAGLSLIAVVLSYRRRSAVPKAARSQVVGAVKATGKPTKKITKKMATFCSECGAEITPNSRFCEDCGASIS
jgi:hypothetical protein